MNHLSVSVGLHLAAVFKNRALVGQGRIAPGSLSPTLPCRGWAKGLLQRGSL